MTYAIGSVILAGDDFGGPIGTANAYANATAATNRVSALMGVGYGSRGYGQQSNVIINGVSVGTLITAAHQNSVINALSIMNTHLGNVNTLPSTVSVGSLIEAYTGNTRPSLPNIVSNFDTNRFTVALSQVSVSSVLTGTRVDPWATSVYHEFTATFADENHARYFFNSGGQVYMASSRTGGSSTEINTALTDLLVSMGTIKIGAIATTYTGTGGTPLALGYYGLTQTFQVLFTEFGTAFGYTSASYTVQARVENVVGVNGGNGSVIRIQAIFATGISSIYSCDGTLVSAISQLLATGVLSITAPVYAPGAPYHNSTF